MALITSAASGNFNATSTWTGGVIPGVGDEARASTGHTITINANTTCDEISNAGSGKFVFADGVTLTANVTGKSTSGTTTCVELTAANNAAIVGDILSRSSSSGVTYTISHLGTGILTITGNVEGTNVTIGNRFTILNNSTGVIIITGNINGGTGSAANHVVLNNSTGTIIVTGSVTATAQTLSPIVNNSTGTISVIGNLTAGTSPAITSSNSLATIKVSGDFIYSSVGVVPVYAPKFILDTTPSVAKTRYALDGIGNYVDMFTADNSLGQANPSDVRSGVSYASGNLTGSLTVPVRGTVSYGVEYGPSMPFTATRSGTTATATMAYSYPYQVGDFIFVTGASNAEWNGDYTIATVVSGTEITFDVPSTHSTAAGTGALAQTKGTATLNASDVATAVWSAAARTITGGTVDTLVNAPSVPSASAIADEVRLELAPELSNLDAPVSGATAPTASTVATAVRSELSSELAKVSALNTDRLAQCSTVATTGAQIAAALS